MKKNLFSLNKRLTASALLATTTTFAGYKLLQGNQVSASEDSVHAPKMDWEHKKFLGSFDTASLRRGYQVYKQVCSSCHSMDYLAFRHLNVCYTQEEIKAIAKETDTIRMIDDSGEVTTRTGIPADYFPDPYANKKEAAAANGGRVPPDLSNIVKARHGGADYIYALLTGYSDAPAGFDVSSGTYYNSYFPGNQIGMAPPLNNDHQLVFPDGTVPTVSQMAKDVSTFLEYASSPEADLRKQFFFKMLMGLLPFAAGLVYIKKHKWSVLKYRKIKFNDGPKGGSKHQL